MKLRALLIPLTIIGLMGAACTSAEPTAAFVVPPTTSTTLPRIEPTPSNSIEPVVTTVAPIVDWAWRDIGPTGLGPRAGHTVIWTGTEVIVWGGGSPVNGNNQGARYDPVSDIWTPLPMSPLGGRSWHSATWTGTEMIIWGGRFPGLYADGAAYDPATDMWRAIADAPLPGRSNHGAVWTGAEMIVFGGHTSLGNNAYARDGAAYDPATDSWRALPSAELPPRANPTVVWTGAEMIVWGGVNGEQLWQADGAAYDPGSDTWRPMAPSPLDGREAALGVWTGAEVVIGGGVTNAERFRVGAAAYDPASDSWRDLHGPSDGAWSTGGWTGEAFVLLDRGALWDGDWRTLPDLEGIPGFGAEAVWTGADMVLVGGEIAQDTPSATAVALRLGDIESLPIVEPEPLPALDGTAAERLQEPIDAVIPLGPRVAGTEAESDASFVLQSLLEDATGQLAHEELVPLPNGVNSRNVWVTLGDGDTHVLLGSHYDSVEGSLGVDDNLSGVSVVIELAARLAREPIDGLTVTIALFGAEEVLPGYSRDNHHFGSRLMAARLAEEAALPDHMVSVDMVGVGSRLMAVTYEQTDAATAQLLAVAADDVDVDITRLSRGDISDHEAFARAGVPSAFMWRPDNPAWHTPADNAIDIELLIEDVTVLEAFLQLVAAT